MICVVGILGSHTMLGWPVGDVYTIPLSFERDTCTVSRHVFPELLYLVGVFIMSHPLKKICLVGPKNPRSPVSPKEFVAGLDWMVLSKPRIRGNSAWLFEVKSFHRENDGSIYPWDEGPLNNQPHI